MDSLRFFILLIRHSYDQILEGGWRVWLFFKGLSVMDTVLDSGIRLHFGNDDFEVLQFKIFTENG